MRSIDLPDNPDVPQAVIPQLILLPVLSQALGAVAALGVADQIAQEPVSTPQLARAVGVDEANLRRCLRVLAATGLFVSEAGDSWSLTPFGESLKSDSPKSTRHMTAVPAMPFHWLTFGRLGDCLKTGKTQVEAALGCDFWAYLEQHPAEADAFSKAMAEISASVTGPLLERYDFTGARTIVDVAGAYGALLAAVLRENPEAKGILFDQEHVVAEADQTLGDVSPRVTKVGGSFFDDEIPAGDIFLLKHILHDWPDEACLKILIGIRKAMPDGAKLLIIEMLMPDEPSCGAIALLDLAMMTLFGSKERTGREYAALCEQAGLRHARTIPTGGLFSILEVEPA